MLNTSHGKLESAEAALTMRQLVITRGACLLHSARIGPVSADIVL